MSVALSPSVQADTVIGNFPYANTTTTSADLDNLRWKALSFTMGADSYDITQLTLTLGNYTSDIDVPVVQIRADVGGLDPGAAVIGWFTAPASASTLITDHVFSPTAAFSLTAGTKYWLFVGGAAATTSFDWRGNSPAIVPTGLGASYGGDSRFTANGGTTWSNSATLNSFVLEGTIVPGPAALALLGLAGVIGSRRRRRW